MKKAFLTAAVMAAVVNLAHAQSNVTIYGILDAGIARESGGSSGSVTKLSSGIGSVSRLGFRGSEELGNGLTAIFTLESGFKADTGEQDTSGSLFNRQAFVGLKSQTLGSLTLGRQYTPWYNTVSQVADPFGAGYAGSAKNLFPTVGANTRSSNTVLYTSPLRNGFGAEVAYSVGEQAGDSSAGRQMGAALIYSSGPLNARLAYNSRNSDVVATGFDRDNGHNTILAVNYDFKVLKAYFAYGQDKGYNSAVLPVVNAYGYSIAPRNSTDSTDLLLGASAPLGNGTLMASFIRKDDKEFNQDAHQWAIGYSYALSKRTSTYLAYARINNKNGAGYTVGNNGDVGSGSRAFNIGLRHAF